MKFLFLFLLCSGLSSFAQTSYVAPSRILSERGYQLGVTGEMWNSTKKIDKDGNSSAYESGESFKRYQGTVQGLYGLTPELQIGGGARVRRNESTRLVSGQTTNDSSFGIESIFINATYAFKPVDRLHYFLEGTVGYTPFKNTEVVSATTGDMILGDEGPIYSIGLGVTHASLSNNFFTVRGGFRNPGKELSNELYWQAEAALVWTKIALVAGVDGVSSMATDPYDKNEANRPVFNTGNTQLYNSSNRDWIAPYAGLNFALGDTWRVELRGSQTVKGHSTDLGTNFGISLVKRVEKKEGQKIDSRFKDYDLEANIVKVSPKKGYVIIDKGLTSDFKKGMIIDFYEFDYVGGNVLVARGTVISTKTETSVVKITQHFNPKKELKEGLVGRGTLR